MLIDAPWGLTVQEGNRHLLHYAGNAVRAVGSWSMKVLKVAETLATRQPNWWWLIRRIDGWEAPHEWAALELDQDQAMRDAVSLLVPALELVDAWTDTLLERETTDWYLDLIVDGLNQIGLQDATDLADTIEGQRPHLLTYHDWLACDVPSWRRSASAHFCNDEVTSYFERVVLRCWRLERAVTNGRQSQRTSADRARTPLRAPRAAMPCAQSAMSWEVR